LASEVADFSCEQAANVKANNPDKIRYLFFICYPFI